MTTNPPVSRSDGFPYPLDDVDKLEESSLAKFEAYLAKKNGTTSCTLENAVKRQEWYDSFIGLHTLGLTRS
jgi:tyrosinase